MRRFTAWVVICGMAVLGAAARAQESFLEPLDYGTVASDQPRFYVSGLIGSSWATLTTSDPDQLATPSAVDPILTAGGAVGMALERQAGRLRFEIEGRGHGTLGTSFGDAIQATSFQATDTWSAMANLWRDVDVTRKLSLYAGGGVGGGGYQFDYQSSIPGSGTDYAALGPVTAFAWQAGCGVNYALTDRITIDLGYRFFAIESGSIDLVQSAGAVSSTSRLGTGLSASEVLLGVRIYEPFRRWR